MGRHKLQTSGLKRGTSLQILDINRIIRVYKKFHAKIIYSLDEIEHFWKTQITKANPKIHIVQQKTSKSQSNPKKEEQSWKHHTFCF